MPQPRIKRYALVPDGDGRGPRRFHLARVAPSPRSVPGVERLERMEEIVERERDSDRALRSQRLTGD